MGNLAVPAKGRRPRYDRARSLLVRRVSHKLSTLVRRNQAGSMGIRRRQRQPTLDFRASLLRAFRATRP